jgi:hypothetical protein
MEVKARFPEVAAKAGHYESFYVKACAPGGGRGIWLRHTVHKRPGEAPLGSLWLTIFDAEAEGPRATKHTVGAEKLSSPPQSWIRVDEAEIGPGRAAGALETDALNASWELEFTCDAPPCRYLPAEWLYEAPVPKTKFEAPCPNARFSGHIELAGERLDLGGWIGMIGHNWGSEHAERWVWLEGTGFEGRPDAYFDTGAARVKLGPWTTPWIPVGMLVLDGEEHRLGGIGAVRSAEVRASPNRCEFTLPGRDVTVRGSLTAAAKDFVGWIYADPKGPEHNVVNCSIADLELTVERKNREPVRLSLPAGGAYEFGMHETDHGVPLQPYPDGAL